MAVKKKKTDASLENTHSITVDLNLGYFAYFMYQVIESYFGMSIIIFILC